MPNPNLINEEQIPSNWASENMNPIVPGNAPKGAPAPPTPHDMPQFFSGSMPPALQHDSTFVGTEVGSPRIPKYSLMPLGLQAVALTNAAIQSTSSVTPPATPSAAPISAITLNIPSIFTPVTQTVNLPGPLAFTLASEPINTFLAAPLPGLTALGGIFTNNFSIPSGVSTHPTITFTPPSAGWAFYMESAQGSSSQAPVGWTTWGDGGALTIPSTSSITATDTVASTLAWCNTVLAFSGTKPTLVSSSQTLFSFPTTSAGTASRTITPAPGNYLIVSVYGSLAAGANNFVGGVTISDSLNDTFNELVTVGAAGTNFGGPSSLTVFVVPAVVGGSTVITANIVGRITAGAAFTLSIIEVTPFQAGSALPLFRLIAATDLPAIPTSKIAGAPISLLFGGTGSNLNATGGAHQVVKQSSAGAALTVGQLDYPDLIGTAAATQYLGVPLVSNGLISEVAKQDISLTTSQPTTLLFQTPATGSGKYRLSWNARVTLASGGGGTSTIGPLTITYTDADATVITITAAAQSTAGVMETSDSGNTTTTEMFGIPLMLNNVKATSNINYAFTYASVPAATMVYSLHIMLEAL